MGWLDTGPALKEYPSRVIYQLLQRIETAVNFLDENNFKNGINGSIVKTGTLPGVALIDRNLPLKKLQWVEFEVFPVTAIPVYKTSSTTDQNIGPYFGWDPNRLPRGDWYLEASIATANATAEAIVTLKGIVDIGSVKTSNTALSRIRGEKLTMPDTAQNLWFAIKTNNSSYVASFAGARLVYIP